MSIPCSNYIVKKDGTITGPGRFMTMSYGAKIDSPEFLSRHTELCIKSMHEDWDHISKHYKHMLERDFPGLDSPDDIAYLIYVHAPENMYGPNGEIVSRHREIMWRMNDD